MHKREHMQAGREKKTGREQQRGMEKEGEGAGQRVIKRKVR